MYKEKHYIRELAGQVAEIAASPEQEKIKRRWRDVNGLRKPDRAPVWFRHGAAWDELFPPESFLCRDPWLRGFEVAFKQILYKQETGDDTPVENWYAVPAVLEFDPPNQWGLDVARHSAGVPGGAWAYDPPLKMEADFEKLRTPTISYNEAETERHVSQVDDLLGDILPVKLVRAPPITATLCSIVANLRGLGQMMMDLATQPDMMHRLMAHLRDGTLRIIDQVEQLGLITPNNTGPMFCSDPVGSEPPDGSYTSRNLWVHADSQEFDQVSPAMWQEFLLDYQKPVVARYGLTSYGCCENLTHKIDGVLTIPNLRVFVSSAWTDLDKVIERVGAKYAIMWRQKASDVVYTDDVSTVKRHLNEGARKLRGCCYQIVLRELQTLAGHQDRLLVWTKLAIEAAERYA